jgi:hypothetical protein
VRNAVDASVSAGTLSGDGWYTTAPTITAQSPAGVTGNPPAGVVTYTVNGGGSQAYTAPFQLTSDGTYNVVFTAYGHTKQLTVKVDLTLPTISITTPPTGTTYQRSTVVNAAYACVETTLGVTVAPTCAGVVTLPSGSTVNVANGGALPTDALGTYQLKVSSTDHAGRTTSLTRSYSVGTPTIAGKIVFARSGKIWSINPDGTGLAQLTQIAGRDASGTWIDDQPAKSPDGTKIVFARRTSSTGQSQLWVIDADGRNPKQLTTGTGDNSAPAFSPDGTKIAFQSNRTGSKGYDIWVGNWSVSTSTLSSLTNLTNIAGDDVQPSWSPTSVGKIAFASNRSPQMQFEIFTMTTKGSSATRLTNDTGTDREPTWSPDGTKIAWSSDRANHGVAGAFDIYVMGAPNGNNQVRLTTLAGDDTAPFFFSNSQIVFASATVGSSGGLAIMAPTGGTPTKIPNTAAGDANPG